MSDPAVIFPQSVASGEPQLHGILLWTRVAPEALNGAATASVSWEIAADAGFASTLLQGDATVDPARDHTVKVLVESPLLAPYTGYWYRFVYQGTVSRTGRFKTLPAANADLAQLKLAYIVCQDYGNGYYTALAHLAAEPDVDYVLHLGDYIYETITATSFQYDPARIVPPFPSGSTTIPTGLGDYRHLYQVYGADPNQQAVHERFAYIQLWDDHEFANDCHQDFHPDDNPTPNTPTPALRQAANQAWAEYGLANTPFDPGQDWEHSIRLYRTLRLGKLADLVITDERLYRDPPPCGSGEYGERYFSLGCDALRDATRSMLGAEQRAWFLQQVTGSRATWKLWANEVMLMQLKATAVYVDLDQWDGYPAERNGLLAACREAKVENLVALTGDIHTFVAGYLKSDYHDPLEKPVGVELVVGSLTSANFAEEIESAIHLPSAPVPAKHFGVPHDRLEPLLRALNPHIKFWESSTHGYAVLTLTPARLVCEFKAVSTIREPTADLRLLKRVVVRAGEAKLRDGGLLGDIVETIEDIF